MRMKKGSYQKEVSGNCNFRGSCCSGGCCGDSNSTDLSRSLGYSESDVQAAPDANMGLGCGNPTAFAELKPGDVVLDLGSGGVLIVFLLHRK